MYNEVVATCNPEIDGHVGPGLTDCVEVEIEHHCIGYDVKVEIHETAGRGDVQFGYGWVRRAVQ
jgi:hypothetical protein